MRRGDHLPHHKYIRNTATCGTTTEHLRNAGRRLQTSEKARNSPRTWVGQKKKEKTETTEQGRNLHDWEGAVKEEKFPHTRKPLNWQRRGWWGGSFGVMEESTAIGVQRANWRDSHTEDRCQPALTTLRCLSDHQLGWVGAGR